MYKCPHCSRKSNAMEVAEALPHEVLQLVTARRNARLRRTRSIAGGRPRVARCPGCSQEMSAADMREHRIPCVRRELKKLSSTPFHLSPKDPDPYPDFYIHNLGGDATEVQFHKGSNGDVVTVDLRKIAEITATHHQGKAMAYVRLLGRIAWHQDIKRWRFEPTAAIGRPPAQTVLHA
jgi:hypothetical protein